MKNSSDGFFVGAGLKPAPTNSDSRHNVCRGNPLWLPCFLRADTQVRPYESCVSGQGEPCPYEPRPQALYIMMQIEYIARFGCKDRILDGIGTEFSRSRRADLRKPGGGKIDLQTSSTKFLEAPAPSAELELEYNDFGINGQDGNGRRTATGRHPPLDKNRVPSLN